MGFILNFIFHLFNLTSEFSYILLYLACITLFIFTLSSHILVLLIFLEDQTLQVFPVSLKISYLFLCQLNVSYNFPCRFFNIITTFLFPVDGFSNFFYSLLELLFHFV